MQYKKIENITDLYKIKEDINNNIDYNDIDQINYYFDSLVYADMNNKEENTFTEKLKIILEDFKYLYFIRAIYGVKGFVMPDHSYEEMEDLYDFIDIVCNRIEKLISEPKEYYNAILKSKRWSLFINQAH